MTDISAEIIQKAAAGDMTSFEAIYNATSRFVYAMALRVTKRSHDAQEVAQNVYVKVYKKLNTFKPDRSLLAWLYRITYNEALNFIRKRNNAPDIAVEQEILESNGADPVVNEHITIEHAGNLVNSMLEQLTPEHRECIIMRELHEMSYQEIADILNININTVRSRLKRAREHLLKIGQNMKRGDLI